MEHNQDRTPILEALDRFTEKEPALFCIPGHRGEKGVPEALLQRFGENIFRYDLTEAPGLDDLHDPREAIAEAQELTAGLFGADRSYFSVNGTTGAIEAMIMAAAGPGEEIIMARNIHRSALSGLVITGAVPVWLPCRYDERWHIAEGITAAEVEEKIKEHPRAKAVFIVSPTYYGVCSDIRGIAEVCHRYGIPLLVDAAHGSHLKFASSLPEDAVSAGADLTAMSLHKTAGAMTQSSVLHYRDEKEAVTSVDEETGEETAAWRSRNLIDTDRLESALKITQSSSPSYILMASLDAAGNQLALSGEEDWNRACELAADLRRALVETPGVSVFGGSEAAGLLNKGLDMTRVVFRAEGISGEQLKNKLFEDGQTVLEMADAENAVAVITPGNTTEDILKLSMAVWSAVGSAGSTDNGMTLDLSCIPEAVYLPREAYFAGKERTEYEKAEGRICGSFICPYPPGTPVTVPGERITKEITEIIEFCRSNNIPMHGIGDDGTIEVLKDR